MIPPEQFKPNWTAIGVVGGFIINIAGWFIVHSLNKRRERQRDFAAALTAKDGRKRAFLAFLVPWRAEIAAADTAAIISAMHPGRSYWWSVYQNKLTGFLSAVEAAKDCCADTRSFGFLTNRIATMQEHQKGKAAKEAILEGLNQLIAFVEKD